MQPVTVVVGIPTFRRPDMLAALLDDVTPQARSLGAAVLVADNDCSPRVEEIVEQRAAAGLEVTWEPVAERGVSQARNGLVAAATRRYPAWDWLVMLDDDGVVTPGWLERLLAGARAHDADIAAGPVLGDLPPGASRLARNSMYAGRPRHPTGQVDMLTGAQNVIVSRRFVAHLEPPWFAPHLGLAGGEDYAFFRRARDLGARLVWVDEAPVVEPTPADRLALRALLARVFGSNVVNGQVDVDHDGARATARRLAGQLPVLARGFAGAARHRDPDRLALSTMYLVGVAGRLVGLLRGRHDGRVVRGRYST